MRLLNLNDYKVEITPEALSIKAFKTIWSRDKSRKKDTALQELALIYFMCDPRSSYMFYLDDEERLKVIKEDEGLPAKWKPDKDLLYAMDVYKKLMQTTSSALLEDTRRAVEKLRLELANIDFNRVDDKGKQIYTLAMVSTTLKNLPELVGKIIAAEQMVDQEITDKTQMRGNREKKLGEDGLSNFF